MRLIFQCVPLRHLPSPIFGLVTQRRSFVILHKNIGRRRSPESGGRGHGHKDDFFKAPAGKWKKLKIPTWRWRLMSNVFASGEKSKISFSHKHSSSSVGRSVGRYTHTSESTFPPRPFLLPQQARWVGGKLFKPTPFSLRGHNNCHSSEKGRASLRIMARNDRE